MNNLYYIHITQNPSLTNTSCVVHAQPPDSAPQSLGPRFLGFLMFPSLPLGLIETYFENRFFDMPCISRVTTSIKRATYRDDLLAYLHPPILAFTGNQSLVCRRSVGNIVRNTIDPTSFRTPSTQHSDRRVNYNLGADLSYEDQRPTDPS